MASSAEDGRTDTALSFDPGVVSIDLNGCCIQFFTVVVQCPVSDSPQVFLLALSHTCHVHKDEVI